jgi:hypothetical protein
MLVRMQARTIAAALLVAAMAACSSYQDGAQAEGNIVAPSNFSAGSGTVSGVGVLRNANRGAAAGSSANRPDPNLYRLSLQMDRGGFQQVDVDNGTFMAGEAVELTNDGRIVRISGTTLNQALRR